MSLLNDITRAERQLRDARDRIESIHRDADRLRKILDAAKSGAAVGVRCTSLSRNEEHVFACRDGATQALVVRLLTAAIKDADDMIAQTEAEIAGRFPGLSS